MTAVLLVIAGYLLGSIPLAFLLARGLAGVDVRRVGSGNVGAANVLRVVGLPLGLAVAALDIAKGYAAVWIAARVGADDATGTATGVAAVLGHVYPVWLGFQGGKGVATGCGAFVGLAPVPLALAAGVFALTVWMTRYVSVGSVVASISLGPLVYFSGASSPIAVGAALTAVLVIYRHRSNLARVRAGTERRLGEQA